MWLLRSLFGKFLPAAILSAFVFAGNSTAALAQATAPAEEGDFVIRLQGMDFLSDTEKPRVGTAPYGILVEPRFGVSYYITNNLAADLNLYTSRRSIGAPYNDPTGLNLGDLQSIPPVITLRYKFLPEGSFSPYLGAGLDYTVSNPAEGGSESAIDYGDDFGYALQAGFDYTFTKNWAINFDLKAVFVDSETAAAVGDLDRGDADLNPWVVGVGLSYQF